MQSVTKKVEYFLILVVSKLVECYIDRFIYYIEELKEVSPIDTSGATYLLAFYTHTLSDSANFVTFIHSVLYRCKHFVGLIYGCRFICVLASPNYCNIVRPFAVYSMGDGLYHSMTMGDGSLPE